MSNGNMNKIFLLGNIGNDPELRYTPKGQPIATLSLATNRETKNSEGEVRKDTYWHRVKVWGKQGEICTKYLCKGSRILVEGELQMNSWTDKEGNPRKTAEIVADRVTFLGNPKGQPTPAMASIEEVEAIAYQ